MNAVSLASNIILFGRVLRRFGLGAQPERIALFEQALAAIGFASRADVKAAGEAIFVRNADERRRFSATFDAFWSSALLRAEKEKVPAQNATDARTAADQKPLDDRLRRAQDSATASSLARPSLALPNARGEHSDAVDAKVDPHGDRSFTYSFTEALGEKDFSHLSHGEVALAHDLVRKRALELGKRESRRTIAGRGGDIFDARRTLRSSLRQLGEPLPLHTRAQRVKHRDIVLLCDISGSMDRYSRLLLQFMHAMRHSLGNVEAFVFGTRLTRITRQMRRRDVNEALDEVAASVADWGGGTRIGECLHEFNIRWARRVLARGAIVIIISDGWDRGDVGLLAREMQRLQRSSYRLIWLNPLLGGRNYRPQTIGMQAALPYIDDFLPAHNLKSLAQLVLQLRSVGRHRPTRRQQAG